MKLIWQNIIIIKSARPSCMEDDKLMINFTWRIKVSFSPFGFRYIVHEWFPSCLSAMGQMSTFFVVRIHQFHAYPLAHIIGKASQGKVFLRRHNRQYHIWFQASLSVSGRLLNAIEASTWVPFLSAIRILHALIDHWSWSYIVLVHTKSTLSIH